VVHPSPFKGALPEMATTDDNERLSVSVSAEQKAILKDIATRNQVSVARVIRQAVSEFIQKHSGPQLLLFSSREVEASDDSRT
jgi:hypothetical protein